MSEATGELMYEPLKRMQHDLSELRADVSEVKIELNVITAIWSQSRRTFTISTAFFPATTTGLIASSIGLSFAK